jgi:hypothetical protein
MLITKERGAKSMKKKKDNYLANAEMSVEGNYNMLDGVINNVPKPSFLERLKEYERRMAEHRKADTETDGGEPQKSRPAKDEL